MAKVTGKNFAVHDKDGHWICDLHYNSYNRSDWQAATKKDALEQARKNGHADAYKVFKLKDTKE